MTVPAVQQERRDTLFRAQAAMLAEPVERRVECPVKHHFTPGRYAREIFIPAGAAIIGKIHRHAHLNNISHGHVLVYTEQDAVQEFVAPCTFESQAGTKRLVVALEDTIWTTYHDNPTDTQDLEIIEKYVIAESYLALEAEERACLGAS